MINFATCPDHFEIFLVKKRLASSRDQHGSIVLGGEDNLSKKWPKNSKLTTVVDDRFQKTLEQSNLQQNKTL